MLSRMGLDDFKSVTAPKVIGTQRLLEALKGQALDFFLMLSSSASIIGNLSQANYAAGNSFMDALANFSSKGADIQPLSINLGPIIGAGAVASDDRLKNILTRQGYVLVQLKELLSLLGYAMSEARADDHKQIVSGFNYQSLRESDNNYSLENPMFCHLLQSQEEQGTDHKEGMVASIETMIVNAGSVEEVKKLVTEAISRKISTLVAAEYEEIELTRRVVDFGLDSLVAIELKNWIAQTFQATVQASEISEAPSIISLATAVVSRSTLAANIQHPKKNGNTAVNGSKE